MNKYWQNNVQYIKGVGPAKANLLAKLGIFTIGDLLEYYPRRYEDRGNLKMIASLADGQSETFRAIIMDITESKPRRGLHITKIVVRDSSGIAQLVWFNQPHIKKLYKTGMEIIATGKVKRGYYIEINNPELEIINSTEIINSGRIVPVYNLSENINQRLLRNIIWQVLQESTDDCEILPDEITQQFNLINRIDALKNIHFPQNKDLLQESRRRLVFEELYILQYGLLFFKKNNKQHHKGIKHDVDGTLLNKAYNALPFTLTKDQQMVLNDVKLDMQDITPMQRLIHGDVGSGKTVIAALALIKTVENGYQGSLMAPTEILAEQHYHTLKDWLDPLGINVALLTGSISVKARSLLIKQLKDGLLNIVIGTHALIQDDVEFKQLGLVVTDEQHRFGVNQRAKLQAKGTMPDVLIMTATPIPRTMALTVYGDLDVSAIRELPPGRKAIKTYVRGNDRRPLVYKFLKDEINKGRQAYIVCPLVEESEKITAQSAVELYEQLINDELKDIPCGLVHGKMKSSEKDTVMADFYAGNIKVLVATTVIEVGVNVPNATIMIIEDAKRFGLAQLHQLRGRIGRGDYQSYCILLSDDNSSESMERLNIMLKTNDGFVLAEEDLKLRGPGQFFGTRQHGLADLKIADVVNDVDILLEARSAAYETLKSIKYSQIIYELFIKRFGKNLNIVNS